MRLVLHQLTKDLRQHKLLWMGWLLLVFLFGSLAEVYTTIPPSRENQTLFGYLSNYHDLLRWARWLLLAAMMARLMQCDSLWGTTAFWKTRPISRGSLLTAISLMGLIHAYLTCNLRRSFGLVILGAVDGASQRGGSNPKMKKAQLRELLTEYGPIEYIWFDHAVGDGGLSHQETLAFVKSLQPSCFVGFNHGDQEGADDC